QLPHHTPHTYRSRGKYFRVLAPHLKCMERTWETFMSNYIFTKAIVAPDQGVDFSVKSHLLKENQWAGLEGLIYRQGIMIHFPGWRSIFSSKPGYTFTSLLTEFRHRDASRVLVIGNQNKLYKYDVSTHLPVEIGAGPYAPDRFRTWKG